MAESVDNVQPNLMTTLDVEEFLLSTEILKDLAMAAFVARLKSAAQAQRVALGPIKRRDGCIAFKVLGSLRQEPNPEDLVRSTARALIRRTGFRVRPRNLWSAPARYGMSMSVCVVPEWRPGS